MATKSKKDKVKKISINTVDALLKEQFPETRTVEWRGIEVTILETISYQEMVDFVNSVVKSCVQDDGNYYPERKDFAMRSNVLTRYANFSLPDNIEHRYDILYRTDAYDFVCGYVNGWQLDMIGAAADEKIEYLLDANITAIQREVSRLTTTIENMNQQMDEMFSGVSEGDLQKMVSAIGESGLTEEGIVKAYLAQTKQSKDKSAAK